MAGVPARIVAGVVLAVAGIVTALTMSVGVGVFALLIAAGLLAPIGSKETETMLDGPGLGDGGGGDGGGGDGGGGG